MRKIVIIVAFLLCLSVTPVMAADLVADPDFDDPTYSSWEWWADGINHAIDTETGDTYLDIGWWWYDGLWQDTGRVFLRDAVYIMTVRARDNGDGNRGSAADKNNHPAYRSIAFGLADVDDEWLHLADVPFQFPSTPGIFGDGTPWNEYSVTFDTSTDPNRVGHGLGVAIYVVNGPTVAAWTSFDYVGLVALLADNPSPANDSDTADDVDEAGTLNVSTIDVTLTWDTAVDVNDITRTDVTKHYVYIQENNPDFSAAIPTATVTGSNSYAATGLNPGSVYHWKVEESINDSASDSLDTLPCYVWAFETLSLTPVITDNPDDVLTTNGGSAEFTVAATSPTAITTYQWYISTDSVADTGVDTPIGTNSTTLTIASVPLSDAGKFIFCDITNADGSTLSDVALLEVERLMGHWALSDLTDSSGNGYTGTTSVGPTYVAGIDGNAVQFSGTDPNEIIAATGSEEAFNHYHLGLTVSLWVNTSTVSDWEIIAGKQDRVAWTGWSLHLGTTGVPQLSLLGVADTTATSEVDDSEWHLITATYDGSVAKMYVDGSLETESVPTEVIALSSSQPMEIGGEASTGTYPYAGLVDDVKVYNYPISNKDVLDTYNAFIDPDKTECLDRSPADVSGPAGEPDCIVDGYDLDVIADGWVSCGLYPTCP